MKYYIFISSEQKKFLSDTLDIENIQEKLDSMIDDSEILELNELLYDHLYLENFHTFFNNNKLEIEENLSSFQKHQKLSQARDLAKVKAENELKRIKMNNRFMSPNIELETLLDLACHTDYEWIHTAKMHNRVKSFSIAEIENKKLEDLKSFSQKPISYIKYFKNSIVEIMLNFSSLKESIFLNH